MGVNVYYYTNLRSVQVTVYRVLEYGEGAQSAEKRRPDPSICKEVWNSEIKSVVNQSIVFLLIQFPVME